MNLTTENLIIVGTVAFSMTAIDLLKKILTGNKTEFPRNRTQSVATMRRLSNATIYLGSVITVVAWGLAAILHVRHSNPLGALPASAVRSVIIASIISLGVIVEAMLMHARIRFMRKRKPANGSLTDKDLGTLKALSRLQWGFLLFFALCLGVTFIPKF